MTSWSTKWRIVNFLFFDIWFCAIRVKIANINVFRHLRSKMTSWRTKWRILNFFDIHDPKWQVGIFRHRRFQLPRCLAFSLRFWPEIKQLLSNCPALSLFLSKQLFICIYRWGFGAPQWGPVAESQKIFGFLGLS
jgi:hypothetical protein